MLFLMTVSGYDWGVLHKKKSQDPGKDLAQEEDTWFATKQVSRGIIVTNYERFLSFFDGQLTFQTFDDKGKRRDLAQQFHGKHHGQELMTLNRQGAGVFLTVNETDGKGRKRDNIVSIRALFVDLDGAPLKPVRDFDLKPHLIVQSSPGKYHAYWFAVDIPPQSFSHMQKGLASMFNGDPVVHDISRVMRVPGFYHNKNSRERVEVLESHDHDHYTYTELCRHIQLPQVQQWSIKNPVRRERDPNAKYGYGSSEGMRNNRLFRVAFAMRKRGESLGDAMNECIRYAQECIPPLPDSEAIHLVQGVWRNY